MPIFAFRFCELGLPALTHQMFPITLRTPPRIHRETEGSLSSVRWRNSGTWSTEIMQQHIYSSKANEKAHCRIGRQMKTDEAKRL